MINLVLSKNDALIIQKNPIIGHLNENSLRKKLNDFKELILNEGDVFLIFEWKLDNCFSNVQCHGKGYRLFRKDRTKFGGKDYLICKRNHSKKNNQ